MLRPEVLHSQDKNLSAEAKDLISRELKLCRALRSLISRELEAIVIDGDMDELFRLLEKKDALISELRELVTEWQDILGTGRLNSEHGANFTGRILEMYPDDKELADLIKQTHAIAGSIIEAENEAMFELDKLSSGVRSTMARRIQGKNAAASYARMGGSLI